MCTEWAHSFFLHRVLTFSCQHVRKLWRHAVCLDEEASQTLDETFMPEEQCTNRIGPLFHDRVISAGMAKNQPLSSGQDFFRMPINGPFCPLFMR